MFAATLTNSSGVHRSRGSFGFSTLGPYTFGNPNSASKGEGRKKKGVGGEDYSMA